MSKKPSIPLREDPYNFLAKKHNQFFMTLKGSSFLYEIPGYPVNYVMRQKKIHPTGLGFISQVKKHVIQHNQEFDVDRSSIRYALVNNRIEGIGIVPGEWVEVDVNAAYWEYAKRLKVINDKIYRKGKMVPKEVRLIALGALATLKQKFSVEDYGEIEREIEKSRPVTQSSFFKICESFSTQIMQPIFSKYGSDCLLFWVDAFIVRKEVAKEVEKDIRMFDMGIKTKPINNIEITDTKIKLHVPYQRDTKDFPRMNARNIFARDYQRRVTYREFLKVNA